ncbi:hypothetical protein [Bradyrhizobium sp. SZCCHNS2002]|uniref:hypothetical protein n=1 Tax=Bradyrhizobium sp. SZCCHNS2002 TaxID=3057302 RepID=UPI002916A754|nr:hypothetical protein [Bradyrhizobium sp. SZCCHNS2002]
MNRATPLSATGDHAEGVIEAGQRPRTPAFLTPAPLKKIAGSVDVKADDLLS